MRTQPAAMLLVTLVALPDVAFACMNSIAREFATYPLEFANLGVALAALILLKWRGQLKRGGGNWNPDDVLDPDEQLAGAEHAAEPPVEATYAGPSVVREFAILAACVIAGIGVGFFNASETAIKLTGLSSVAMVGSVLVMVAILVSRIERLGTLFVWMRYGLLLLTALVWIFISAQVYSGPFSGSGPSFAPANADVASQVRF